MLSVTVLAVVLGAAVLVPQYRTFAGKAEAIKAVQAYGTVLAVSQQVAGYRAPYISPVFQEGPATQAQLDAAAKAVQVADAAFADRPPPSVGRSTMARDRRRPEPGGCQACRFRAATDRALALPMSGRDPAAVKGFLSGIAQVTAMIEPLLNRLENQVAMADASLTAPLNVARTSQDLRVSAGARAASVLLAVTTHRPLTAAENRSSIAPRAASTSIASGSKPASTRSAVRPVW